MGWPFTSGSSPITLGEKEPMLVDPRISSFCLLPGCIIHDPILLALQLPHTKAEWPPLDKSSYPLNCSISPLGWMLSSGHGCETKRFVHFMPAPIGLNSCCFSRTLIGEGLPTLLLQWHWWTIQAICHSAVVQVFSYLRLLVPPHQVDDQVCFASRSFKIHSLACSPSICWSISGRSYISFVEYPPSFCILGVEATFPVGSCWDLASLLLRAMRGDGIRS